MIYKLITEKWKKFLSEERKWVYPESHPEDQQTSKWVDLSKELDKSLFTISKARDSFPQKPKNNKTGQPGRFWANPIQLYTLTDAALAAKNVQSEHPFNKLIIGDVGWEEGGKFYPHNSHRTGLDIDTFFFTKKPAGPFKNRFGWPKLNDLDVERNIAFLKSLSDSHSVKWIMVHQKIINYLLQKASKDSKNDLLDVKSRGHFAPDKHHYNHYHIRFLDKAQEDSNTKSYGERGYDSKYKNKLYFKREKAKSKVINRGT